MRALLIDDDPSICTVITRILSRQFEQLEIVECQNGVEALEVLSRDACSLLLLDLQMPMMDGFDVLESLRRMPSLRSIPVIVMTGINDEETVRRILQLGVTDYILKPVRPVQLCERVSKILKRAPSTDRAGMTHAAFVPLDLHPKADILIADGNEDFRQFFRKSLAHTCRVDVAASGLEAFQRCLEQPPHAIFIGSDLGLVNGDILIRKLRDHPRLCGIRVIGIEPQRTLVQARKRGTYEAVILRSFVQEVFMEGIGSLLERHGAPSGVLSLIPDLKLVTISAAEEALSTALQSSVVLRSPRPGAASQALAATVMMKVGDDGVPIDVRLSIPSKNAARLAQTITADADGGSDDLNAEQQLSTLVTGVVKAIATELRCRNLPVVWDDPLPARLTARKATAPVVPSSDAIMVDFDVPRDKLSLRVEVTIDHCAPSIRDSVGI